MCLGSRTHNYMPCSTSRRKDWQARSRPHPMSQVRLKDLFHRGSSWRGDTHGSTLDCSGTIAHYSCSKCFQDYLVQQRHLLSSLELKCNFARSHRQLTEWTRSRFCDCFHQLPGKSQYNILPFRTHRWPWVACNRYSSHTYRSQYRSGHMRIKTIVPATPN